MKKHKYEQNFRKYYPKLRLEGAVKAALFGLVIGFGADLVTAIIAWSVGYSNFWLPIGVGGGVAVVSAIASYFILYKPSISSLARRVDGLGLEERAITMLELANDKSPLAALQRADAVLSMEKVRASKLKIRPSKIVVMLAVVFALLGASATTVVGLTANDIIPDGTEIVPPEEPVYYEISYMVYGEGGEIIGETDQILLPGEYASPVVAVPYDGYVFKNWIDTSSDPTRENDQATIPSDVIYAYFTSIDNAETEEGEGEPDEQPDDDGDSDENAPNDEQENENDDNNTQESPDDDGGSNADGTEGGGRWDDQNTIIDGTQYYYDSVETYKELAMEYLASNQEIPDYIKIFLETYYDGLS